MITVAMVGLGLTGCVVARHLLKNSHRFELVMAAAGPHSSKSGQDLGLLLGIEPAGIAVHSAHQTVELLEKHQPDVLIDFTRPANTLRLLRCCRSTNTKMVVGTTGFSPEQIEQLQDCTPTGVVFAPNITMGVNVLMLLARIAAQLLPNYDIEITERHHRYKRDAPSGTAARLANQMAAARDSGYVLQGRNGLGSRKTGEVGVHSVRAGGIYGEHELLLASDTDELTITHRVIDRAAFAEGALDAAEWIMGKTGFFNVEQMLLQRVGSMSLLPA